MIIIKNFKPDFILGVGGFSSFAVILTAWIFRIENAIQEQNAFPGITNRVLSKFTKTIFTSFKNTNGFINNPKVKFVGNPVRKDVEVKFKNQINLKNYDSDKFTILVTGGSQGAASINNAFIDAVKLMKKAQLNSNNIDPNDINYGRFDPSQCNIIHQTGVRDEAPIIKKYKNLKIDATAKAFFHDMPVLQTIADLVITRAGAGIISELSIKGVPAILIPFPHAADDHQTFNAKALKEQGAAIMIHDKDLNGQILKQTMEDLIQNRQKLKSIGNKLKQLAMPDADKKIASYILKTGLT
jgi:UDP-N-acetylglucosamine--N-acetylmuramyl-(pentapeptide) pyrophosphoryl-undecaprenol N-acetylglucosamine transferase